MTKTDHDILIEIHTRVQSIDSHLSTLNGQVAKNTKSRISLDGIDKEISKNNRFRIQGYLIAGILSSITVPLLIAQIMRAL